MGYDDRLWQRFGSVRLTGGDGSGVADNLTPFDPIRRLLLDLFSTAINAELGADWTLATATLKADSKLRGTTPVQSTGSMAASLAELQTQNKPMPLLALTRTGTAEYSQLTIGHIDQLTQQWMLTYTLGPVSQDERHKLGDVLVAGLKVIALCIARRGHPAYNGGVVAIGPGSGLHSLRIVNHQGPGSLADDASDGALAMYSVVATLETRERTDWIVGENLNDFEGTDLDMSVDNGPLIVEDELP